MICKQSLVWPCRIVPVSNFEEKNKNDYQGTISDSSEFASKLYEICLKIINNSRKRSEKDNRE